MQYAFCVRIPTFDGRWRATAPDRSICWGCSNFVRMQFKFSKMFILNVSLDKNVCRSLRSRITPFLILVFS